MPPKGIADQRPSWMPPRVTVRDDGSFVCRNLPAGPITVVATARDPVTSDPHSACLERVVSPGERIWWDAVLARAESITGTLHGEDGDPLSGWTVTFESVHGNGTGHKRDSTDEHGAFVLRDCLPLPHVVWRMRLEAGTGH